MTEPQSGRRRWRRWAVVALLVFALPSAVLVATRRSFSARAAQLRPGMTRAEVFAVMGGADRLIRLGDMEIALFTPLPFALHALITRPVQTLGGNASVMAQDFPVYVEFQGDRADRIRVNGHEVPPSN